MIIVWIFFDCFNGADISSITREDPASYRDSFSGYCQGHNNLWRPHALFGMTILPKATFLFILIINGKRGSGSIVENNINRQIQQVGNLEKYLPFNLFP